MTTRHRHIYGPRSGIGRWVVLALARGWIEAVCVVCGRRRKRR